MVRQAHHERLLRWISAHALAREFLVSLLWLPAPSLILSLGN